MNRGMAVVESFMILKNHQVSEEEKNTAIALGWAVEMVLIRLLVYISGQHSFFLCLSYDFSFPTLRLPTLNFADYEIAPQFSK